MEKSQGKEEQCKDEAGGLDSSASDSVTQEKELDTAHLEQVTGGAMMTYAYLKGQKSSQIKG